MRLNYIVTSILTMHRVIDLYNFIFNGQRLPLRHICCIDLQSVNYSIFNFIWRKNWLLQEVDSDDEWQGLIEQTDQEGDPDVALKLLQDIKFQNKLKSRIQTSSAQVLDGMLEGAARLKTVLRVITNLVTLKWYKLSN